MPRIRLATLNLKKSELDWERRATWLLRQLVDLDSDVVAFQEVDLRIDQGNWIRERLNERVAGEGVEYRIHHMANPRDRVTLEALAILARLPVVAHDGYDYLFRNRVAHRLRVVVDDAPFDVWNTHLHHEVGAEANAVRRHQAEQLSDWIAERSAGAPHALVGDLNATPDTAPLRTLGVGRRSAYEAIHGRPPATTVSPLGVMSDDLPGDLTLDYILVGGSVNILDAGLAFEYEDPRQPGIWASDHVGLVADLEY
jgi:endonuclease/exonuclease/phosphatase family metal-dependent hydrolase